MPERAQLPHLAGGRGRVTADAAFVNDAAVSVAPVGSPDGCRPSGSGTSAPSARWNVPVAASSGYPDDWPVRPPAARLHDLRHTHATILLTAGVPVHVVSQRLDHASPVITLQVYAHVVPGSQRDAAQLFARLVAGAAS
jgi:integrase